MRRISVLLLIAALSATVAVAQGPNKQEELDAMGITHWIPGMFKGSGPVMHAVPALITDVVEGTDTLQYDSGVINALPTIFGQVYGNQFNVTNGGGALGGTLTASSFHFYFMEDSLADTGLFFQPASFVGPGTLNALASVNIAGLANSGQSFSTPILNTVSWGALGIGASTFTSTNGVFLGGWCLNTNSAFPVNNEALGLDTTSGAAGLKGYTALSGVGNLPYVPQSFNAVLRLTATAPNIPVELMAFDVE